MNLSEKRSAGDSFVV